MPLQPGEVPLLTLFSDIHTYFGPPIAKPVHHRFDKRSYFYLYHDALNKRGRVEVANHAGTPEQDAFTGYLDASKVEYSYRQPNLFTITISAAPPSVSTPQNDLSQWHVPAFDLRSENKYMYKIHTIDVYLWKPDDASLLLDSFKRVLHAHQLQVDGAPPVIQTEYRDSMSPVVQNLERVAITTPMRSESVSTTHSFPGPPTQHTPTASHTSTPQPAPMAYNPAAPAAPEPIAHREKTPPPPDAENGTGLHGAPSAYGGPVHGGFAPQQTSSYTPGVVPGMPMPGIQCAHTLQLGSMNSNAPLPPPPQSPYGASFAAPPRAPPNTDPNAHLYANAPPTPGLQRQHTAPYTPGPPASAPPTQYASYPTSYNASAVAPSPGLQSPGFMQQQQTYNQYGDHATNQTQHSMHQNLYIPEGYTPEAGGHAKPAQGGQAAATGKFEQRAEKLEKGVGRFLKKLDKKF
ncbi:hypothetical protein EG327_009520 [Venturia inaequalis]|uniref:RNA recognition motif-containing protein n=1 Tax=Venturia inaequalis TaxID=5025 RepID=A0A8H3UKI5_VENIN|nr:hypothetical protein EG327_009520 [Venturia inaequalis]